MLALVNSIFKSNTPMLTFYSIGSNSLRALQGLGLLEAISPELKQSASPDEDLFVFLSGTSDQLVYDVSFINTTNENIT